MPLLMRVTRARLATTPGRTRLPFRFGVTTLTEAPIATLEVEIENEDGDRVTGYSSDLLIPKWFDKSPDRSDRENQDDLRASVDRAASAGVGGDPATVFDWWRRVYEACHVDGCVDPSRALVSGFGVALMERAVIDAACRMIGLSFAAALREDAFGFEPGSIWPELATWDHAADLGQPPADGLVVRHTVGMADPLRPGDVADRVGDGLPECLVEDIERYGLDTFKVKLCGRTEDDLARLLAFSEICAEHVEGRLRVTVDANEQFASIADLVKLFDRLSDREGGRRLLGALLLVEQPLKRQASFDPAATAAMARLRDYAPCIIDEADVDIASFDRALDCGYQGVSVKNCKGVFRALLNRGLVAARSDDGDLFQSAEDLTNLPMVALQQDLCTQAILGLEHVERNGHHYFRGLTHLPDREVDHALRAHQDLYEVRDGLPQLRIEGGRVEIASLHQPGYAHAGVVAMESRTVEATWGDEA